MRCTGCDTPIPSGATACPMCGAVIHKMMDEKYCHECGKVIKEKAEICPKCGIRQRNSSGPGINSFDFSYHHKSRTTAALLAFFLGWLGAHKFYLGQPVLGLFYFIFSWSGIPIIISFIEGLNFLFMSDTAFNKRY